MRTERHHSERRRVLGALLACAAALTITVTATAGIPDDGSSPSLAPPFQTAGK